MVQAQKARIISANSWNLGGEVEVIDAEVFAISEALNTVATRKPPLEEIFIFSNSQTTIRQFQNETSSVAEKAKTVACD